MSLFGKVLGGVVGTFVPGGSAIQGLLSKGAPKQVPDSVKTSGVKVAGLPFGTQTTTSYYSQGKPGTAMVKPGAACGVTWTGTHWRAQRLNKSTYVTRGGGTSRWPAGLKLHPAGTECVTVRRRNVANGKALRRAISRLKGFVKTYRKAARLLGHGRSTSKRSCTSCGRNPCRCK